MPKTYIIGGTPRAGKTTLLHSFLRERPMVAITTDAIRDLMRNTDGVTDTRFHVEYEEDPTDEQQVIELHRDHPEKVVELQNIESKAVWNSCKQLISSSHKDGIDILIEGIAATPENIAELDHDISAVYVGATDPAYFELVRKRALANPHDWMHTYSDEVFAAYTVFFVKMAQYFKAEAEKFGFPYIEVHPDTYDDDIKRALASLLA